MYLYKESELLNELPICDANYIRNTYININTDIVEFIEQLESLMQKNGVDSENGNIIENIIDTVTTVDVDNYYRIVFVEDDINSNIYYCVSNINDFRIGDEVLLKADKEEIEGLVREVAYYSEKNLPVIPSKLCTITEILYK